MKNFAGRNDADAEIEAELVAAGITTERLPEVLRERMGEVKTIIMGWLHGWRFERAWRYWIAQGPGIPPVYADDLHRSHGREVRVDGNCTCPSPREWMHGFAVGLYHVDSQDGLNALAQTIRRVVEDANEEKAKALLPKICENCFAFHFAFLSGEFNPVIQKSLGQCRFNPPIVSGKEKAWPVVKTDDWCRCFKVRK